LDKELETTTIKYAHTQEGTMEALFLSKALFWSSKLTFTVKFLGEAIFNPKTGLSALAFQAKREASSLPKKGKKKPEEKKPEESKPATST